VPSRARYACRVDDIRKFDAKHRQVADDQAGREHLRRLDVFVADAVVADVRIGQRDDLPAVARVGQDLLVTGQRGVEHHLADVWPAAPIEIPWKTVPSARARTAGAWESSKGSGTKTPDFTPRFEPVSAGWAGSGR
jgi:hypothetical protein